MMHKYFPGTGLLVTPTAQSPFRLPKPEMVAPDRPALPDSMTVEVDYGEKIPVHCVQDKRKNTKAGVALIKAAIKKGRFVKVTIAPNLDHVPVGGCGKVAYKVKDWAFDRPASVHNALHVIVMTHRLCFANPLTSLAVARDFPRHHQFHELVTFFHDHHGRMCHLVIRDDEGARELEIDYVAMNYRYDIDTRFLTIVPDHLRF
jgi:hypothetical protein